MKKIGIIGVPLRYGQSIAGVEKGPEMLRSAGLISIIEEFCEVVDYHDIHIHDGLRSEANKKLKNLKLVRKANADLYQVVSTCLKDDAFPLVLGGDHALAIGSVAAVSSKMDNLGLIWFDAHTDINTASTSPSGNIHGMSLACLLGIGDPSLVELVPSKIKPEHVVIMGARSMDPGEIEILEKLQIKVYTTEDVRRLGMGRVVEEVLSYLSQRTSHFHLSFDIDSLDPVICPGVGVKEDNGLTLEEVKTAMRSFGKSKNLVSMDLVELNPLLDQNEATSKVALDVVRWILEH